VSPLTRVALWIACVLGSAALLWGAYEGLMRSVLSGLLHR
jgi:hypothetical protein